MTDPNDERVMARLYLLIVVVGLFLLAFVGIR